MTVSHTVSLGDQGITTRAAIKANLGTAALVEEAIRKRRGAADEGRRVAGRYRQVHRPQRQGQVRRPRRHDRGHDQLGRDQPADVGRALGQSEGRFPRRAEGPGRALRRRPVRRQPAANTASTCASSTQMAWHNLFVRTLLVRPTAEELAGFTPEYTIINLPSFKADPARHGCRSDTVIAVNLTEKLILIGNTEYSGEMKKGVFGLLNFLLPAQGVMPMHCSANIGADGKSAIFFGLSGTGKTTLSADASRTLIGDDEHGWSDKAVFNFEGGCYAKMINLSAEGEPEIYATTKMFGTILENVTMDPDTRELDFTDASKTENTRGAYPIEFIPNTAEEPRPAAVEHHPADRRRVRRAAADRAPHARPGDVPLPVGLHRQGRRDRDRRDRAQATFRPASARRSCRATRASTATCSRSASPRAGRSAGWSTPAGPAARRRRQADADQGHPRAAQRRARRQPQRCRVPQGPELRLRGAGRGARRRHRSLDPRAPGRTRTNTTAPRTSWCSCSSTTSPSSKLTSTRA